MMPWVSLKEAAHAAAVHPETVKRWAHSRRIRARRLAAGHGPWRIYLDADGLPADLATTTTNRSTARAKSRRLPSR